MPVQIQTKSTNQIMQQLFNQTHSHRDPLFDEINATIHHYRQELCHKHQANQFNHNLNQVLTLKYLKLKWLIEHFQDQLYQFAVKMSVQYQLPILPSNQRNQFIQINLLNRWTNQWHEILSNWPSDQIIAKHLNATLINQFTKPNHNAWLYFGLGEAFTVGKSPILKGASQNQFQFELQIQNLMRHYKHHHANISELMTVFNNQNIIPYLKIMHRNLMATHLGKERGLIVLKTRAFSLMVNLNQFIKRLHRNLDHWFQRLHINDQLPTQINHLLLKHKKQNYLNLLPTIKN